MRLIDADDFMKFMTALEESGAEHVSFDDLRKFIDNQPTAFDVDKAVEMMEGNYLAAKCRNGEICDYPERIGCCYDRGVNDCVEIVKSIMKQ